MAERRWWPPRAAVAGLCAGLAVMTLGAARPESWREDVFDLLLGLAAPLRPATGPLPRFVFVDIDAASLTTIGPWPWPRETLARLVARTQAPGPKAIAIDILLAEPDTRSPAALARRLAGEAGRADLADLAGTLTDGDRDGRGTRGHRVGDLEGLRRRRGDPAAADVELLAFDHVASS